MGLDLFTCGECAEPFTEYSQGAICKECGCGICRGCVSCFHEVDEDGETEEACQECRYLEFTITIPKKEYEELLEIKAKYEGLG